ncbi:hypothetical protein AMECASPLE_011453 [Ameca splendens]|uniref:PSI domain-containing protein n=1 Tax=Ameca splendens TaxID=208324 RepID=A0ABV0XDX1_9TELE
MYVFGGFSGLLLNDVLAYTPPSCRAFLSSSLCLAAGPGVRCHWVKSKCLPWESIQHDHIIPAPFCPARPDSTDEQCIHFSDCASCTANTRGCQWCEDRKCISASSNCTVLTLELAQQHGGALSLSPPPSMLSEHQLSLWKHGGRRRGHVCIIYNKENIELFLLGCSLFHFALSWEHLLDCNFIFKNYLILIYS